MDISAFDYDCEMNVNNYEFLSASSKFISFVPDMWHVTSLTFPGIPGCHIHQYLGDIRVAWCRRRSRAQRFGTTSASGPSTCSLLALPSSVTLSIFWSKLQEPRIAGWLTYLIKTIRGVGDVPYDRVSLPGRTPVLRVLIKNRPSLWIHLRN